jgi:hypothetical protein
MSKHPPQPTWTGKENLDTPDLPIDGYINYVCHWLGSSSFILIKKK